jgi:hypothetical protein
MSEVRSSWIKAHGEEAIAMAKAGHSFAEIAKWLEGRGCFVSRAAVGGYVNRVGLRVGRRPGGGAVSLPQCGARPSKVHLPSSAPRWHKAHGAAVIEAYRTGTTAPALVGWLGVRGYEVSESAVRSFLAREGVVLDEAARAPRSSRAGAGRVDWVVAHGANVLKMIRNGANSPAVLSWLAGHGYVVTRQSVRSYAARHRVRFGRTTAFGLVGVALSVAPAGQAHVDRMMKPKPGEPAPATTLLGRRRDQCAWVHTSHSSQPARGDDPCCGAPVVPGTSWCKAHHKRVFA